MLELYEHIQYYGQRVAIWNEGYWGVSVIDNGKNNWLLSDHSKVEGKASGSKALEEIVNLGYWKIHLCNENAKNYDREMLETATLTQELNSLRYVGNWPKIWEITAIMWDSE